MSADLKDHFLASPMNRPEYMKIPYKYFPDDIIKKYNLQNKVSNGYIYIKIKKGMYGLKQAALLAYNKLVQHLAPHGYRPVPHSLGLWTHDTRPTSFCLCVDDFGIKYFTKNDANHLLDILKKSFKISTDWEGKNYCGLTIDWNYDDNYADISMPGYIDRVLHRFQHPKPPKPQYAPHTWTAPVYGQSTQYAREPDQSPPLDSIGIKYVQSVVGSLLYYSRAVDPTMLPALNEIATFQANPTENTKNKCKNATRLCSNISKCKNSIPCQRYGIACR